MNNAFIYILSDPRNGLVRYIGKTNDPDMRFKAHLNSSRDKNTHKRNWINNIKNEGMKPDFDIIDEVPIDEWQYWEKFYISLFKCWGFNLLNYTSGGDGATFANKGTWKKGNVPHNKGIPHSEEVKNKIREKLTGVSNVNSYKPIIQYDINFNMIKRYRCIRDAVNESNGYFIESKISNCLTGKRRHHRNYIWKYDNGENLAKYEILPIEKGVIQYGKDLIEVNRFPSINSASRDTGILSTNICACCKGKVKTAGGYIWKYS